MDTVLNRAVTAKMSAKHISVSRKASNENMKRYCVISMLNRPAVTNDMPCESANPSARPTTSDTRPTTAVSMSTMADTLRGFMPSMRYVPNSFLRRLMRKPFA